MSLHVAAVIDYAFVCFLQFMLTFSAATEHLLCLQIRDSRGFICCLVVKVIHTDANEILRGGVSLVPISNVS